MVLDSAYGSAKLHDTNLLQELNKIKYYSELD